MHMIIMVDHSIVELLANGCCFKVLFFESFQNSLNFFFRCLTIPSNAGRVLIHFLVGDKKGLLMQGEEMAFLEGDQPTNELQHEPEAFDDEHVPEGADSGEVVLSLVLEEGSEQSDGRRDHEVDRAHENLLVVGPDQLMFLLQHLIRQEDQLVEALEGTGELLGKIGSGDVCEHPIGRDFFSVEYLVKENGDVVHPLVVPHPWELGGDVIEDSLDWQELFLRN